MLSFVNIYASTHNLLIDFKTSRKATNEAFRFDDFINLYFAGPVHSVRCTSD